MSDVTELPLWVYELIAGLHRYEDEHPPLYRMTPPGIYERAACPNGLTSLIPRDVSDAAELLVKHGAITAKSMFPATPPSGLGETP